MIARYINAIGPDKSQVTPRNEDGSLGTPTTPVQGAHRFGLIVTPYTFRTENAFLPTNLRVGANPVDFGRAIEEDVTFMRTGIDGRFCDQPDICLEARKTLLAGT